MEIEDIIMAVVAIVTIIVIIAVGVDMKRCSEKGGSYIQYQCLKVEKIK